MTFEECFSFENLIKMHKRCRVGKTHKKEVIGFELNLGENLIKLSMEVLKGYKVSKYKKFKIYEPKERIIEALPYKDRLVQMALCCGIIEPILGRKLVYDNTACQKGKGTHFAIKRLHGFLNKFYINNKSNAGYFLKVDIAKYFASINHEILKNKLLKCFNDKKTLELMFKFIDSSNCESGYGLPLGNQTSQWFALLYLDEIDRLIKETMRFKYYVRYMDDLIIICEDKEKLEKAKIEIDDKCKKNLKLNINAKTQIGLLKNGIDFLGFRHILSESGKIIMLLRQQAKYRIKNKLKLIKKLKDNGYITDDKIKLRLNAYKGHLQNSNSYKYFVKLKNNLGLEAIN